MTTRFLNQLTWRRALKRFGPSSPDEIDISPILQAARLAPTANGLQPFNIHVVSNAALKSKISAVAFDQPQVTECAHLLVFTGSTNAQKSVDRFIKALDLDKESPPYAKQLRNTFIPMSKEEFSKIASNQACIALGFSIAAAADLGIASCPMGGFLPEKVHEVMQMDDTEFPVAFLAVGKPLEGPNAEATMNPFPKRRLPLEDFVKHYK